MKKILDNTRSYPVMSTNFIILLVGITGLEPVRLTALDFESSVSTNSTISPYYHDIVS